MQAFSGIMSITGEPDGAPVRAGVSFLDLTTGIFCAFGIVNALLHRVKTGVGQRVDGSLLETAVTLLNYHAEGYLLTGAIPKALGSSHPSLSPYRTFKCRDGQWIFIAGANDRFWQRLAPALGLAHMTQDPRFAKNIDGPTWSAQVVADKQIQGLYTNLFFAADGKANIFYFHRTANHLYRAVLTKGLWKITDYGSGGEDWCQPSQGGSGANSGSAGISNTPPPGESSGSQPSPTPAPIAGERGPLRRLLNPR